MNFDFPQGFKEKYARLLGKQDLTCFLDFSARPLRKSVRVNTLKISVKEFKSLAKGKKWILTPIPWCAEGFWIDRENREQPLGKTLEHALGLFFIQESSSMLPPAVLGVGERVIDMCSAPGSKATQLAAMMKNNGVLVSNDASASRIKKLAFNLLRSRVQNAVITNKNGEKFIGETPAYFDRVLLDAPCTGEGTVRKDYEALQYWSEQKIAAAAFLQKNLLKAAFETLKPGGELVYSTCTLAPEENEAVVADLLARNPQAELVDLSMSFAGAEKCPALPLYGAEIAQKALRIWPQIFDSEGFFVAKIRKKSASLPPPSKKITFRGKLKPLSSKEFSCVANFFATEFACLLTDWRERLFINNNTVFVLPTGFVPFFPLDRAGFALCELHGADIRLTHEGAYLLGEQFTGERVLKVDRQTACAFFAGQDFERADFTELKKGQVILVYEKYPLGTCKIVGENLKNLLPRNFVQEVN